MSLLYNFSCDWNLLRGGEASSKRWRGSAARRSAGSSGRARRPTGRHASAAPAALPPRRSPSRGAPATSTQLSLDIQDHLMTNICHFRRRRRLCGVIHLCIHVVRKRERRSSRRARSLRERRGAGARAGAADRRRRFPARRGAGGPARVQRPSPTGPRGAGAELLERHDARPDRGRRRRGRGARISTPLIDCLQAIEVLIFGRSFSNIFAKSAF